MTPASLYVKLDVEIVPQTPFILISTLPSRQFEPFTRRISTKQLIIKNQNPKINIERCKIELNLYQI